MLLKILFVLSCNVLLIESLDDTVIINGSMYDSCMIMKPEYTFTDRQTVTILTYSKFTLNHVTWRIKKKKKMMTNFTNPKIDVKINSSFAGKWIFELFSLKDNNDVTSHKVNFSNHIYTLRNCSTMVRIVPAPPASISTTHISLIAVGVALTLIILAQTTYILFLKSKARALNRHENLSKKAQSESSNDEGIRYCSHPGQKVIKVTPITDPELESDIYEAPHIELPERGPAQPPQPPAVANIPRTPRIDTDMGRLGPLALAAALTGSRHPTQPGSYPTPKKNKHEINVANRPPLPLPPQETYEEMPIEENTYEPPPIKNTLPPVKPQKLTKDQLETVVKALSMKPAVTPKPQTSSSGHMKIPNELENTWRRRNVVQVPIVSIPGSSSKGTSPHKPRPPPVVKSKPPVPLPVDQGIYYNERHHSSDEEWTYEPLKPVKGYSSDNIYNV